MPDEPVGWVTITAGDQAVTIPSGVFIDDYGPHRPRRVLQTRGEVTIPANRRVEVPLFPVVSNPTPRTFGLSGWVRDGPLREATLSPALNLEGVKFYIVSHWKPRTEQEAREGMLRLLQRRKETQPRTRYERISLEDDLL